MEEDRDGGPQADGIELPIPGTPHDELTVTIEAPQQGTYVGLVVQSKEDPKGVRLLADFPVSEAPLLTVGKRTLVVFAGGDLEEPLPVQARVVFRTGDVFRQRYQFLVPAEIQSRLGAVINRRKAMRVRPHPARPVQTVLVNLDEPVPHETVLQDVSTTGACLLVTRELEEDLYTAVNVEVSFDLPDEPQPVVIVGRIRYRKLSGFVIRYGVEFDAKRTPEFEQRIQRIQRYVTGRLVEEVQRLNAVHVA